MKVKAFRIRNFRSIVDTNWCSLSMDGVTVLVGQNESGKSSILTALSKTFSDLDIEHDDLRFDAALPEIFIRTSLEQSEVRALFSGYSATCLKAVTDHLARNNQEINWRFSWEKSTDGTQFIDHRALLEPALAEILEFEKNRLELLLQQQPPAGEESEQNKLLSIPDQAEVHTKVPLDILDIAKFEEIIWRELPEFVFFDEETGLLPNRIDITEQHQLSGEGKTGAVNFLAVSGIDLKTLCESDARGRGNVLRRANERITNDFASFWSQVIGKSSRLSLSCDIALYGHDTPEKVGKPYLVFWISDGNNQLYPRQRSKGVTWFVSFYLQFKASEMTRSNLFFLLDEPGSNLHSRAQEDVLKLINRMRGSIDLVYSTHDPHLIEYDKLYRIIAVQREGDDVENPTRVIDAHRLGAASRDTLSPILSAMGADLSHQQVIKKKNNVILEEISGFYYLSAFWKLSNSKKEVHFIAATGVSNVRVLAQMFLGWGLGFAIAVDDDPHGRQVYNDLKRDLYKNDDALAQHKMLKIKYGTGIEDIFTPADFKKLVLLDQSIALQGSNSEHMKSDGLSKPIVALQFLLSVNEEKIKLNHFEPETARRIEDVVSDISARLN